MTKVISKEQCLLCHEVGLDTAEDNMVTFCSGVKYCHRHGYLGNQGEVKVPRKEPGKVVEMNASGLLYDCEYSEIRSRGISKKTCEFYGYQVNKEKGIHVANYYDDAGNIKMQQWRTSDKKFPIYGDRAYNETLWGIHKFTPSENVFITITEGHLDALSIAQAFDCKFPVVSLPNGASSAVSVVRTNLSILNSYKYVVLAFDNDKPGKEATQDCLKLFEPGKVRVAHWKRKDANEYFNKDSLQWENVEEIRKTIWSAVEYLPPAILTGDALLNTLTDYKTNTIDWPWPSFNRLLHPIYVPGIYTIAGRPNVGKTSLMAELIKSQISQGNKVGVISLEEPVQRLLLKITSLITGFDLKTIKNRNLTEAEVEKCREVSKHIVTYNHKDYGSDLTTICESLPYIAQALNCKVIIFDNLSYAATNTTDEERRAIDKSMIRLQDNCVKYNYTLFNIAHLNTDDDEAKDATIRGSRGVQMYSSYVIHIDRDIESENPVIRNILNFYVKKDRESGEDVGKHLQLSYNTETRQFEDLNNRGG